ncbi:hypothetical protein QAD02_002157 [Eretmocerus hayati]|uniref:Uncharacterized protein n=1 Tax=Eretmocerus hayati TaxID=131215 RepID=A0ACC2NI90_9HYME|nr:hypothetical protein QAD02_002157 [Eretmocerus hayati]
MKFPRFSIIALVTSEMVVEALLIEIRRRRLARQNQMHQEQHQQLLDRQRLTLEEWRQQRKEQLKEENEYVRMVRDHSNPFTMVGSKFVDAYRLPQVLAMRLINLVEDDLMPKRLSRKAIPAFLKVLIFLRFCAQGSYQLCTALNYLHPCSQPSVSKIISQVLDALLKHGDKFIMFPQTAERRAGIESAKSCSLREPASLNKFMSNEYRKLIPARQLYVEMKYRFSHFIWLSYCSTCDSDYNALSVKLLPGHNHDRFHWRHSPVRKNLEALRLNPRIVRDKQKFYALANVGYVVSPILMTLCPDPRRGTPQPRFNEALVTQRCKVEQVFGQLEEPWRCLNKERILKYQPKKACQIIRACFILHNFRKAGGIPLDQRREHLEIREDIPELFSKEAGVIERDMLIRTHYT